MAVEGGGAYRQSLIRNKRLRDEVARERANKYGIPSQALVAGARGGSRLAMTPGASGLGAKRVRTSMTAGPGTMIEEMMPQNIIRGAANVRGNVRRTGTPALDESRPLLATISAFAGEFKDTWQESANDPAAQAYTRSPGFFAGRAGMKSEAFAKEGSAEESARKARQDYKMFEDTWRAYSGGKSVDEFIQGAVVSPDGVVNFGGEAEQFMKAMEGTAAALGALNYVGWGAGKAVAKGLKAGLGPAITGTLGATTRAAGRLGRGGYAATTVGIRAEGAPVKAARTATMGPVREPRPLPEKPRYINDEPVENTSSLPLESGPELTGLTDNQKIDALRIFLNPETKKVNVETGEIGNVIGQRALEEQLFELVLRGRLSRRSRELGKPYDFNADTRAETIIKNREAQTGPLSDENILRIKQEETNRNKREINRILEDAKANFPDEFDAAYAAGGMPEVLRVFQAAHIQPVKRGGRVDWSNIRLIPEEVHKRQKGANPWAAVRQGLIM